MGILGLRGLRSASRLSKGQQRARLTVPIWRLVGWLEALVREKGKAWALVACSEDDHVALNFFFATWSALRNALRAVVEENAVFGEAHNVSAEPFCSMRTDLVEDVGVYHRCLGEEAFGGRGEVRQVAVEENFQYRFGAPGERGFLAEDIEGEEAVDNCVPGDDPFL